MILEQRVEDNTLIVRLVERLDSASAPELEQLVTEKIDAGQKRLVFDLADMDYVSSAGLRVILLAGKRLRVGGGKLALAGLREMVREVFEMSGFVSLFPIAPTVPEAVAKL